MKLTFGHTRKDGVEELWIKDVPPGRMIHGIASTSRPNKNFRAVRPEGCDARLPLPLFWKHKKIGSGIGEVVHLRKSESGVYIRARLFDNQAADYAWELIKEERLTGLSCGYEPTVEDAVVDDITFIKRWTFKELSITPRPANIDCRFEIYEG